MKKVAVITGGSSGIGKEISLKFLQEGFVVIVVSRSEPNIEGCEWFKTDLTSSEDQNKLFAYVKEKFGQCDLLVNNAGVGIYDTWEKMEDSDLRNLFELNFFSIISLTKLFLPLLKDSRGTVINTSSVAGKLYVPCMGAYCASKSAVYMLSHSLRVELSKYDINVLNLVVGRINTGFSSRSFGSMSPPETPGGGSPKKLANVVYSGYLRRKKEITYPYWYKFAVPIILLISPIYDKINIKKWGL